MVKQPDPNDIVIRNPHGIPAWDMVVKIYGEPIQGGRYRVIFRHWSTGAESDNFARWVGKDDVGWQFFDGSEPGYSWYPVYWRLIKGPDDV